MIEKPRAARPLHARSVATVAALAWSVAVSVVASPAQASDQLELTPDFVVTGILLVSFILLIFPLNSLIFKPLLRVMDDRESKISGTRSRAADVQGQAEGALDRYQSAVREAREAAVLERRRHVEAARAELLQTTRAAKDEAEAEIERAREELQSGIAGARDGLRQSVEELAHLSAERVLGRSLG